MLSDGLERLDERMQSASSVRGEPSRIREQLRENGHVQAELEKLRMALENVSKQAAELVCSLPDQTDEPQGTTGRLCGMMGVSLPCGGGVVY